MENKCIVLWGAGKTGYEFYKKFCHKIEKPIYWVDSNSLLHGKKIFDIEVISPDVFFELYNKNKINKTIELIITARSVAALEITALCFRRNFFDHIKYALSFYCEYYFSENYSRLNEVLGMFCDDKSRQIFNTLIDNLSKGRLTDTSLWDEQQYFPNSIIDSFSDNDVIVDAGVCKGEEIDRALALNQNINIYAFEPNLKSYDELILKYKNYPNVVIYPYAVWDKNTTVVGSGSNSWNVSFQEFNTNDDEIRAVRLDDIIKSKVDYIKMDIEGAEMRALMGAKRIISTYQPNMAICIYHNIEDYIDIPLYIKSLCPEYNFYLRHHGPIDAETVFYAIRK